MTSQRFRSPGNPGVRASGPRRPAQPSSSRRAPQPFFRWLARSRRLWAALFLCAAAAVTVQQLTPAPEPTGLALAASRDLPVGTTLQVSDVAGIRVPLELAGSGYVRDASLLTGKQLAAPARKGQLLTDSQLLGAGLLAGTAAGTSAVPLRLADPASIQLVSPGQRVTIVLTSVDGSSAQGPSNVLAANVPVLWTSAQGGSGGQWLGTSDTDGLLVVAATPEQAPQLAGASTRGKLYFVLVAPP